MSEYVMDYKLSITKEEINELPIFTFEGDITLIETKKDALACIKLLASEKLLGFDTETRAAFKKGESYEISLLQLATSTSAFLFRLNRFKIIPELTALLANPNILKVGVAVKDDIKGLKKLLDFQEEGFIDLAHIAKEKEIKNFGLRGLTAIFLSKRLTKRNQTSNWEKIHLSTGQISYAACDAVAGFQIYNIIKNI